MAPLPALFYVKYWLKLVVLYILNGIDWLQVQLINGLLAAQKLLFKLHHAACIIFLPVNFLHMAIEHREPEEAHLAIGIGAPIPLLVEVPTLMLQAVATGGKPPGAVLTLKWLLAGVDPQV